jgi:hypothetical protein
MNDQAIKDFECDVKRVNTIIKNEDKSLPHAYKVYSKKPGYKNFTPETFGTCRHAFFRQRSTALEVLAFAEKWFKTTEFQIRKNGRICDLQAEIDKETARHELNEACKLMSDAEWLQKCRFYRSRKLKNAELPNGKRVILKAESTATNFRTTSKDFLLRLKPKNTTKETPAGTTPPANNSAVGKSEPEQKNANMLTASPTQAEKIDLPSKDATLQHSDNEDPNMAKRGRPKKYPPKQHFGNVENRRPRTEWLKLPSGKMSNAEFRKLSAPWQQKELAELLEVPERQITRWRSPNAIYPVPDIIADRLLALPPRPCPSVSAHGPEISEEEKITREKQRRRKISLTRKQRWDQDAHENANMLTNEEFRSLTQGYTTRELADLLEISTSKAASYRRKANPPRIPNDIAQKLISMQKK